MCETVTILCLVLLAAGCAGGGRLARLTRGPYLQRGGTNEMTIVWRTDRGARPVVRYGAGPTNLVRTVTDITARVAPGTWTRFGVPKLAEAPRGVVQYEARIRDLAPASTYYYAVFDGTNRLAGGDEKHFFTTAPGPDASSRIGLWALGDSGTGDTNQLAVYQAMLEYTARHDFAVDLVLHVGDMAYWDGRDAQFQERFFDVYQPTLRHTVCWPALGNHEGHSSRGGDDVGPYFDAYVLPARGESGGAPSGTEAYYSFDYGPVHFVVLDSYDVDRTPQGAMLQWLARDLARAEGARWLLAFWHHAPYSKGTHDSDTETRMVQMREDIMPILEDHGVDLVLSGHSHIYERSMLMDGAYHTPTRAEGRILDDGDGDPAGDGPYRKSAGLHPHEGTVQIVTGHGGALMFRRAYMPVMFRSIVEHGSVLIAIEGDSLDALMLDKTGAVRDRFAIRKQGRRPPTAPLANPWQPLGPRFEPMIPFFLDRTEVALRSSTHWPDEEIHYTLDRTEPTRASPRYTAPIPISRSTTIKARAYHAGGGRPGPVTVKTYTRYAAPLLDAVGAVPAARPGLAHACFEGDWNRLPDFAGLTPAAEGVVTAPSLDVRTRDDAFALRFQGFIDLPADGIYAFSLASDDGSRLLVDRMVVVDNDGLHPLLEKRGYVGLRAGLHRIEIQFLEKAGAQILQLQYAGPGIPLQDIPATAWRRE